MLSRLPGPGGNAPNHGFETRPAKPSEETVKSRSRAVTTIYNNNEAMSMEQPKPTEKEKDGLTEEQRELAERHLSSYSEKDIPN